MKFPGFGDNKQKILFFTRGRGRGHAIPDMEIARKLEALSHDVEVRFVSYGTGASTFEAHGVPHIDLGLPDRNPTNETIVRAGKLIGWLDPDLVVAHEEFAALPVAKIFDKPTALITDWFTDPAKYSMSTLAFADRILFLDEQGVYDEPEGLQASIEYVGPVVREFTYSRADRGRAREELGIEADAFTLAMLPGSWREAVAPSLDVVLGAFDSLDEAPKHLIWVAGEDYDLIREKTEERPQVDVRGYEPEIGRIFAATDVAITKANRMTLFELASLGIATVSLNCIDNPIDLFRAGRFANNELLSAGADAAELSAAIGRARGRRPVPAWRSDAAGACARSLLASITK